MSKLILTSTLLLTVVAPPALAESCQTDLVNGQALAAQCYQCHGPNGHSLGEIDSIAGTDIYGDILEMKQETKTDIMHLQMKGYTDAELCAIAKFLATQ